MRDLSLCLRLLEGTAGRLETHDERFLRITDLAQEGAYAKAADAVEALASEGLHEVRLSGYYLYAALQEEGLCRLPDVLDTVAALVRGALTAPEDRQTLLLNKGLTWLFQTLVGTLRYHQGKNQGQKDTAAWEGWLKGFTEARCREGTLLVQALLGLMEGKAFGSAAQALSLFAQWLQERPAAPVEPPRPAASAKPRAAKAAAPANALPRAGPPQLRGSVHLQELCDKLKAFEVLIERRDFQKAALVSDDILRTLEAFDPRRYFPELFSTFGGLLNRHVQDIQEHWERKDSMEWRTLAQFYQVDLAAFVGTE